MVRKRSRTTRKHYDSDDNDSDSDFSVDEAQSEPAPKKYSLRQRKKALFINDYDYEDDDEILPIPPMKATSDDEDYEIEQGEVGEPPNSTYSDEYQEAVEDPNGLIDFEDMIRADIVMNRNRIDYDNVIDKNEITVQINKEAANSTPVRAKRGRKPKKRPENEVDSSILEPETDVQEEFEDKNDVDYTPEEKQHDPKELLKHLKCVGNLQQSKTDQQPINKEIIPDNVDKIEVGDENEHSNDNTDTNDTLLNQESVIKFNESYLYKHLISNGTELPASHQENSNNVSEISLKDEDGDDDDDVVFIEDNRAEIIILDD